MMLRITILLTACTLISRAVIPTTENSPICKELHPQPYMWCPIGLTLAMDFSRRMGSDKNIGNLVHSIVADILPAYEFHDSSMLASFIAFGQTFDYTVDVTPFYQNYSTICEDIVMEEGLSRERRHDASLRFVLKAYYDKIAELLPSTTQKVLTIFTAINDENDIYNSLEFSDKLRKNYGVIIIAVYVGSEDGKHLEKLADKVFATNSYNLPAPLINEIIKSTCINPLTTVAHPVTTTVVPSSSPNPTNDEDGIPCASEVNEAWLDIAIVIEQSTATTTSTFRQFMIPFLTNYISNLTISSTIKMASRIAVITFDNSPFSQIWWSFSDVQTKESILTLLKGLNKPVSDNAVGNIESGFKTAQKLFNAQPSNRVKIILLLAATYDLEQSPVLIADELKEDMVKIISIFCGDITDEYVSIAALASSGLAYKGAEMTITDMTQSLAKANCHCPSGWTQLQFTNDAHLSTPFSECFFAFDVQVLSAFVECPNGSLVTVTTAKRLNFLQNNVIPEGLGRTSAFSIGLTRLNSSESWTWSTVTGPMNYTGYPKFKETPGSTDSAGYLRLVKGEWSLFSDDSFSESRPYICQRRGCDAQHYCKN